MSNSIDRFNLSHERTAFTDPEYDRPYGSELPALRAYGNVTYLQLIDIITNLWEKAHPEIQLIPYGSRTKYDSENGYVVYSLEQKRAKENNTKPRMREDVAITDEGRVDIRIFTQSFVYLIEFVAVHPDPRMAEYIREAFDDLMLIITPEIKMVGAEDFFFTRGMADRDQTRFGQDVATRNTMYTAILQRMIMVRPEILESIQIEVRINREMATPEFNEVIIAKVPSPDI